MQPGPGLYALPQAGYEELSVGYLSQSETEKYFE